MWYNLVSLLKCGGRLNMNNMAKRIIAAVLVLPMIADYAYYTINLLIDRPKYASTSMVAFYILDIIALIAVIVGALIGKYAISLIGIMAYATVFLISIISQIGDFTVISMMMIAQCIPPLVIFTMMALLLGKMVKPMPVAITVIVITIIDLIMDFAVRIGNHMRLFVWANYKLLITTACYCAAIVIIVLLTEKKSSEE